MTPTLHTDCHFKKITPKGDHHTRGKWLIQGLKHHKESPLLTWNTLGKIPFFEKNVHGKKHKRVVDNCRKSIPYISHERIPCCEVRCTSNLLLFWMYHKAINKEHLTDHTLRLRHVYVIVRWSLLFWTLPHHIPAFTFFVFSPEGV